MAPHLDAPRAAAGPVLNEIGLQAVWRDAQAKAFHVIVKIDRILGLRAKRVD